MKNITLAIDENVLAKVRRIAAEKNTTVNGLVREHLSRLAEQDNRAAKARSELVALSKRSTWDPGPDWKWNREELYDRPSLRRLKRANLRGIDKAGGKSKKSKGG